MNAKLSFETILDRTECHCLTFDVKYPKNKLTIRVKCEKHIFRHSISNDAHDTLRKKQSSVSKDRQVHGK